MGYTIPGESQGKWLKVVSDQLLVTGAGRVLAVALSHTVATAFELNDSTDGGGADIVAINIPANETKLLDYSALGGVPFVTGLWADWLAGVAFVCVDV